MRPRLVGARQCRGCGAELSKRSQKVYCGDACQGSARRENLRLFCPNCDSQQPTSKSRNRGRGGHFRRQRNANGQSY
ncbi:hypothetical protein [Mycobacterium sp. 1274761.0]|uniref:hypothetical protein n=1 Tax=Mycobacterium sp. 1274761.0 TaxID=1834077 RepID=UPI0009ED74C9|nr:hypothetical protein [Mycobacterium sp. 1274761.0]